MLIAAAVGGGKKKTGSENLMESMSHMQEKSMSHMAKAFKSLSDIKPAGWEGMTMAFEALQTTAQSLKDTFTSGLSDTLNQILAPFTAIIQLFMGGMQQGTIDGVQTLFTTLFTDENINKIVAAGAAIGGAIGEILIAAADWDWEAIGNMIAGILNTLGTGINTIAELAGGTLFDDQTGTNPDGTGERNWTWWDREMWNIGQYGYNIGVDWGNFWLGQHRPQSTWDPWS